MNLVEVTCVKDFVTRRGGPVCVVCLNQSWVALIHFLHGTDSSAFINNTFAIGELASSIKQ